MTPTHPQNAEMSTTLLKRQANASFLTVVHLASLQEKRLTDLGGSIPDHALAQNRRDADWSDFWSGRVPKFGSPLHPSVPGEAQVQMRAPNAFGAQQVGHVRNVHCPSLCAEHLHALVAVGSMRHNSLA